MYLISITFNLYWNKRRMKSIRIMLPNYFHDVNLSSDRFNTFHVDRLFSHAYGAFYFHSPYFLPLDTLCLVPAPPTGTRYRYILPCARYNRNDVSCSYCKLFRASL